ncbi:tRNA lysidine(34) synthetase TilS [Spirosoma daeguense]
MLETDFLAFINDQKLLEPDHRVLLAVSGGLDSMVMAHLFYRNDLPFAIAHVNFGLRGAESDADASFVRNKADEYGVPFHLTQFHTAAIASERNLSIQMAARQLRYVWFNELLIEHRYAGIATAHHQNDVLETVLLNLTRGTGLAGLHGIAAKQGNLIRPMLFATRDQLATYAEEQNVTYREDSSNREDKYARNRIRHHVVPVLTGLNAGFWQTWPRTIERLRGAEILFQEELDRSWREIAVIERERIWLPMNKLMNVTELAFRLGEWLRPFGFTADQILQLIATFEKPIGQVFRSATYRIFHERNGLLLEPLPVDADFEIMFDDWPTEPVTLPNGQLLLVDIVAKPVDFKPTPENTIACLDANKLTLPITIRKWKLGDRFRPLGMKGTKLVSDLLNDLKVSRLEREQTYVLLTGDQIAWVIGRRIAHPFRIASQTKSIIQISFR